MRISNASHGEHKNAGTKETLKIINKDMVTKEGIKIAQIIGGSHCDEPRIFTLVTSVPSPKMSEQNDTCVFVHVRMCERQRQRQREELKTCIFLLSRLTKIGLHSIGEERFKPHSGRMKDQNARVRAQSEVWIPSTTSSSEKRYLEQQINARLTLRIAAVYKCLAYEVCGKNATICGTSAALQYHHVLSSW